METTELLKKVRQIEIKTRGLSNNIFAGQYHSAFKGRGMAFSEVREYQFGDDIRDIDWNVTARFNKPYVKVFEEERELTVMLLVDVSGSLEFGTVKQMKKDMVTEIADTLHHPRTDRFSCGKPEDEHPFGIGISDECDETPLHGICLVRLHRPGKFQERHDHCQS